MDFNLFLELDYTYFSFNLIFIQKTQRLKIYLSEFGIALEKIISW